MRGEGGRQPALEKLRAMAWRGVARAMRYNDFTANGRSHVQTCLGGRVARSVTATFLIISKKDR